MADDLELRIARLELERGDILVVQTDNQEIYSHRPDLQRLLPSGVRLMFIPHEIKLSVLTKAEIESKAV